MSHPVPEGYLVRCAFFPATLSAAARTYALAHVCVYLQGAFQTHSLLGCWSPAKPRPCPKHQKDLLKFKAERKKKKKSRIVKCNFRFRMIQTDTDTELKAASFELFLPFSCVSLLCRFSKHCLEPPPATGSGCGEGTGARFLPTCRGRLRNAC